MKDEEIIRQAVKSKYPGLGDEWIQRYAGNVAAEIIALTREDCAKRVHKRKKFWIDRGDQAMTTEMDRLETALRERGK